MGHLNPDQAANLLTEACGRRVRAEVLTRLAEARIRARGNAHGS